MGTAKAHAILLWLQVWHQLDVYVENRNGGRGIQGETTRHISIHLACLFVCPILLFKLMWHQVCFLGSMYDTGKSHA